MNRGFLPFIVGGLLLGSGLDLAGTCPGMVYVEVSGIVVIVAKLFKRLISSPFVLPQICFIFPFPSPSLFTFIYLITSWVLL